MAFVAGKTVGCTWTPAGGSGVSLNVTEHTWSETIDAIDVTHTGTSGVQAMIGGIGRGEATVKANLDDASLPFNGTNLIRAGQKGVLYHQTATSSVGYSIPCMITRVNTSVPVNGAINYEFTVTLDAIAGVYAYDTTP